ASVFHGATEFKKNNPNLILLLMFSTPNQITFFLFHLILLQETCQEINLTSFVEAIVAHLA
ncbi:hypothetical protein, partial [Pueribacillus sp. YX66]|uniref:hypothetical protein n=1 Tax=Pueribacillus sp. YX66 TaxID=3229242 RepID=UPI00358D52D9